MWESQEPLSAFLFSLDAGFRSDTGPCLASLAKVDSPALIQWVLGAEQAVGQGPGRRSLWHEEGVGTSGIVSHCLFVLGPFRRELWLLHELSESSGFSWSSFPSQPGLRVAFLPSLGPPCPLPYTYPPIHMAASTLMKEACSLDSL